MSSTLSGVSHTKRTGPPTCSHFIVHSSHDSRSQPRTPKAGVAALHVRAGAAFLVGVVWWGLQGRQWTGASCPMTRRRRQRRGSLGWCCLLLLLAALVSRTNADPSAGADGVSATATAAAAGAGAEGEASTGSAVNLFPVRNHNPAGVLDGIHVRLPRKVRFLSPHATHTKSGHLFFFCDERQKVGEEEKKKKSNNERGSQVTRNPNAPTSLRQHVRRVFIECGTDDDDDDARAYVPRVISPLQPKMPNSTAVHSLPPTQLLNDLTTLYFSPPRPVRVYSARQN